MEEINLEAWAEVENMRTENQTPPTHKVWAKKEDPGREPRKNRNLERTLIESLSASWNDKTESRESNKDQKNLCSVFLKGRKELK